MTILEFEGRRPPADTAPPAADPRQVVLDAVAAGVNLTGPELAGRCDLSARRAREVIAGVRDELDAAAAIEAAAAGAEAPGISALDRVIMWVVGLAAAAWSFSHMLEVAIDAGAPRWAAPLWPITVDGLALVALRHGAGGRRWLVLSLVVSIAANVGASYPELVEQLGPAVSAWPPIALASIHHMVHHRPPDG